MFELHPELKRHKKFLTAIGLCAAVGGVYGILSLVDGGDKPQSHINTALTNQGTRDAKANEHYDKVLDEYNRTEGETAKQSGQSFVSVMQQRPEPEHPKPQVQMPTPPPVVYTPYAPVERHNDSRDLTDKANGLVSLWAPRGHGAARVSEDGAAYVASLSAAADGQRQGSSRTTAPVVKIVEDYALVPAILETALDTDENSVVSAYVPNGPYQGARLFAMGYKRITNTIDMTFTAMEWRGVSYKVNAKPVDPVSMRSSLSGEVDNRYFSRIVLPALANGLARVGGLYEQASSQNIITSNGAVIQTYPTTPDGRNVAGTVLGGAAQHAGNVMAADAARIPPKQVTLLSGSTIGIQFIGPVLSSDAEAPQVAVNKGAEQGQGGVADNLAKASEAPAGTQNYPASDSSSRRYPHVTPAYPMMYFNE